jgi:hypothetical protein
VSEWMPGVFISYRRDDSADSAHRVAVDLRRKFGDRQVFVDIENIDPGARFEDVIDARLNDIDAFVPIIGPGWLTAKDHEGRVRLFNEHDLVRQEIAHALSRGVEIVPVLVDGASMPRKDQLPPDLQPLCRINALIAGSSSLGDDIDRLARALRDDLTVRSVPARAGGAFLYSWTGYMGVMSFLLMLALADCSAAEGSSRSNLPLAAVVLVFAVAFAIIIMARRRSRARRGARRVAVTVFLYLIGPTAFVAALSLGVAVDPNY